MDPFAFFVLVLLHLDLGLVLYLLQGVVSDEKAKWIQKNISVYPAVCSLNFVYAYLSIDFTVSFITCLSLYHLTYTDDSTGFSPSAWLVI